MLFENVPCKNCDMLADEHAKAKCPFAPTQYLPYTRKEVLATIHLVIPRITHVTGLFTRAPGDDWLITYHNGSRIRLSKLNLREHALHQRSL